MRRNSSKKRITLEEAEKLAKFKRQQQAKGPPQSIPPDAESGFPGAVLVKSVVISDLANPHARCDRSNRQAVARVVITLASGETHEENLSQYFVDDIYAQLGRAGIIQDNRKNYRNPLKDMSYNRGRE